MRLKFSAMGLAVAVCASAGADRLAADPAQGARTAAEASSGAEHTDYRPGAKACLAEAVYYESRGTSARAGHAVAHVVLNRREHVEFPETVCAVVSEGCQFSYRCDGKPENLADEAERERAFRAAEAVMIGDADDPTDGALFFHSEEVQPGWFETRDPTVEIGGNIFYR